MPDAIGKIDQEPDTHPDEQPEPCVKRKCDHLGQADDCAKDRDQWDPGCPERPVQIRSCLSQDDDADTDNHKSQQCANRNKFAEHADRKDTCKYHSYAAG